MKISNTNQQLVKEIIIEAAKNSPAFDLFCKTIINENGEPGENYNINIEPKILITKIKNESKEKERKEGKEDKK